MAREKRILIWVLVACLVSATVFYGYYRVSVVNTRGKDHVNAGFILIGDESTPYSANFIRAIDAMEMQLGDRVSVSIKSNVAVDDAEAAIRELCEIGCDIVITNSYEYGFTAKALAPDYPDIQFCSATCDNANEEPVLDNYHTFMGEIAEGWYVSGLVAGTKLNELIDSGTITPEEAWIGEVGAYPYAEVVSGFTAFLLGARQVCPTARLKVRYIYSWSNYTLERECASRLINEGCVIITQATDTIGPAVECENARVTHPVFHVSYNQSMTDVAPTTSITGSRIDWSPYICGAVEAVLEEKLIEDAVSGNVHGNDIGAGFEKGWVRMLELNSSIAPAGSEETVRQAIEDIISGKSHIFQGDYLAVDPNDPNDVWDLNTEYLENANASAPSFHYILQDIVVEE